MPKPIVDMKTKGRRILYLLISAIPMVFFFQNCTLRRPQALDQGSASKSIFDHSVVQNLACTTCHEKDRPAAMNGVPHGNGQDCRSCHASGQGWLGGLTGGFNHAGITGNCASCHQSSFPVNHVATGGQDCVSCHTPGGWKPANFNHSGITASCTSCHQSTLPATHVAINGQDCSTCHATSAWKPANFNHSGITGTCTSCHQSTLPTTHIAINGQDCNSCHTTVAWKPVSFNHTGITASCTSCHQSALPATHIAINGQDCSSCHTTNTWKNATYNHSPVPSSCTSCHLSDKPATGLRMNRDPKLSNNSHYGQTDCVSCHQTPTATRPTFVFTHKNTQGANVSFCLPCHYDKGFDKHGKSQSSYFQPPIYDFAAGKLGNCTQCHNRGKSWDQ